VTSGQVDDEAASGGLILDPLRPAVGAEDGDRAAGDLVEFFDEFCATGLQRVDDTPVVNNLMAHVDGRLVLLEGALDDVDRPHHPCAKPAGLREQDPYRRPALGGPRR
jgi:hypothetical protein